MAGTISGEGELRPPPTGALTATSVVVASDCQVSTRLSAQGDDEAVILDTTLGMFYSLGGVGATIWGLVQSPVSVQKLREARVATFAVDPARCERDLWGFLERLLDVDLTEVG